jgi:hypothetical protein
MVTKTGPGPYRMALRLLAQSSSLSKAKAPGYPAEGTSREAYRHRLIEEAMLELYAYRIRPIPFDSIRLA